MKKVQRTVKQQRKLDALIIKLPRCSICNQILIATCDRSKPSKLVKYMGRGWTKTKPQFMNLYSTGGEQSKLCPYCKDKLHPIKIGKGS